MSSKLQSNNKLCNSVGQMETIATMKMKPLCTIFKQNNGQMGTIVHHLSIELSYENDGQMDGVCMYTHHLSIVGVVH
jgi:hypothetical protein